MSQAHTLLATVGLSMLRSLPGASKRELICQLRSLPWSDPAVGAELNSLELLQSRQVMPNCLVHYFLSDTAEGQLVGDVLQELVGARRVRLHTIEGLDPGQPQRFARKGLPKLAAELGKALRGLDPAGCAIDATGGFKAQVGVAVTLGQALQIPVYYRHESFAQIIALPPMPVSLDAQLWCQNASLFFELAEDIALLPKLPEDPRLLALLDWQLEEDEFLVSLNATGVIFHEALCQRWPEQATLQLPRPAPHKDAPTLADHGWPDRDRVLKTMQKLTDDIPYITRCHGEYLNPDLPGKNTFLIKGSKLLAVCSDGTYTVRFQIHTTARNRTHREACLADLLLRLHQVKPGQWLW